MWLHRRAESPAGESCGGTHSSASRARSRTQPPPRVLPEMADHDCGGAGIFAASLRTLWGSRSCACSHKTPLEAQHSTPGVSWVFLIFFSSRFVYLSNLGRDPVTSCTSLLTGSRPRRSKVPRIMAAELDGLLICLSHSCPSRSVISLDDPKLGAPSGQLSHKPRSRRVSP